MINKCFACGNPVVGEDAPHENTDTLCKDCEQEVVAWARKKRFTPRREAMSYFSVEDIQDAYPELNKEQCEHVIYTAWEALLDSDIVDMHDEFIHDAVQDYYPEAIAGKKEANDDK